MSTDHDGARDAATDNTPGGAPASTAGPASGSSGGRPRRRRGLAHRAALGLVPVTLLLAGVEGALRARAWSGGQDEPRLHVPDPYTGYVMPPDLAFVQEGYGGRVEIRTNALGHRSAPLAPVKPPGGYRVACLGGSTTFGFAASTNDATYPALVARSLDKDQPARPVEVLNAGVQGWNLRDSLTNFQLRLADLDLDLVVVLHAFNDLHEAGQARYHARSRARGPEDLLPAPGLLEGLLERSAVARALTTEVARRRIRHRKHAAVDPRGREAFERNLRATAAELRARGVGLLLCTYPHVFPATPEAAAAVFGPKRLAATLLRSPLEYEPLVAGLEAYNDVIRRVAAEEGAWLADLARDLPADPALYVDFIHQNDAGEREKAARVARAILEGPLAAR